MQTLKTAAIVVLLMTVMYGAYVSLTTPPEPLPEDVQDMLVIHEEGTLAIDASLPESLGALEINSGSPLSDIPPRAAAESAQSPGVAALELPADVAAPAVPPNSADLNRATASTDPANFSSESGITTTLTDVAAVPANAMDIPARAVGGAAAQTAGAARSYPRTGSTFELPDPNAITSTFHAAQNGAADANLALTSGTSDSPSVGGPPSGPTVSPISALDQPGVPSPDLGLANAIRTADKLYQEDKRKEALATLSIFYNTPNLSGEQRSELLSRLDPLAREVIYSTRHLLQQPHRVGQNETLMEIAARYEVPWQLLANINQIEDPVTVIPGTELKVVRGPFRADVNVSTNELTLFLGDLYAGRFPIGIGNDPTPKPGTFTVQDKQTGKTFYDAAGSPVPPRSPDNPYGEVWLDLGGQLCIHGSPSTTSPTDKGCISLAADLADDLYGILSQGSSVTIRR